LASNHPYWLLNAFNITPVHSDVRLSFVFLQPCLIYLLYLPHAQVGDSGLDVQMKPYINLVYPCEASVFLTGVNWSCFVLKQTQMYIGVICKNCLSFKRKDFQEISVFGGQPLHYSLESHSIPLL
jgi:hypothetical protein